MYIRDSVISGFLLKIAKFKTSSPSSKLLSNWFTTAWVFLSNLGADGKKRSLSDVVVFVFTGTGSTTLGKIGAVVVFVGRLAVMFVGRLAVMFVGRLAVVFVFALDGSDFNETIFTKAIIELDSEYPKFIYNKNNKSFSF